MPDMTYDRESVAEIRVKSLVVFALLASATVASAQSRPRVGYAGTAKPEPAAGSRPTPPQPVVIYNSAPNSTEGYTVYGAPYLVLNDGSVLVNFGNGYERVLRQCASNNQTAAPAQTDKNGLDALAHLPLPLINNLSGGERGQVSGTMPAKNEAACYRSTRRHHVQIVKG